MRNLLMLALTGCAGTPLMAEGFPPRPKTCELVSTAQHSDCEVENRYRCNSGEQTFYRIEFFGLLGMISVSQETADFLPVNNVEKDGSGIFMTKVEGLHPREMIAAGVSTQRLEGEISIFGFDQPFSSEIEYTSTGETVVLAGKSFETIEGQLVFNVPNAGIALTGRNVLAYRADIDVMIEIETSLDLPPTETTSVREFFLSGQPGFGAEFPTYGCFTVSRFVSNVRLGSL